MQELDRDSFEGFIKNETPSVVDFWAPWCMPCRIFSPIVEELSDEMDGQVEFGRLNIDDYPELAQRYGIASIPTLILFKSGKAVGQMVGVRPKQEVAKAIQKEIS